MIIRLRDLLLVLVLIPSIGNAQPQHIAPTEALSPADERKTFRLPKGFEAQLVAAEPAIGKPMQIAFDSKGRLWVTTSRHYPFAAEPGQASDRLYVLSEFAADGSARKIQIFDDKLNIPIGILPIADGKSCIVSSVGEILRLTDTNGDGKADRREVLYTGFGTRDTHGMYNSFTLMPDGWIYACHGFANESHAQGKDGKVVSMQSGHTFRFRLPDDGVQPDADNPKSPIGGPIEIFTRGQVNPFGMTVDPWGNLYTADCHSKPITQLIRGSYYDSFGKPHDGLGYGPHVTRHDHGSTALCGLAWYEGKQYPSEYRGCMYLGNVVTNRINADKIEWKGSTPVAVERPDFLVSSDPWFRPTDIKLGPDGALYVADFYNRIIGHYEVDLKHPLRDKDHGRIWRIVYTGKGSQDSSPASVTGTLELRKRVNQPSLSSSERGELLLALASDARTARVAVDALTVHADVANIPPLLAMIPVIPSDDTHLRHAAKIALRNALQSESARDRLPHILKHDLIAANAASLVLDETFLGAADVQASGWFSDRIVSGKLDPRIWDRASEHVGRYGTDAHRQKVAKAALSQAEMGKTIRILKALAQGNAAAGNPFRVEVPKPVIDRILSDVRSANPETATNSLILGELLNQDLSQQSVAIAKNPKNPESLRITALNLLEKGHRELLLEVSRELILGSQLPRSLYDKALSVVSRSTLSSDQIAIVERLKSAPYQQCVIMAQGLAGSKQGAEHLFSAIKAGQASPRLLQERLILERLKSTNPSNGDARIQELTAGIPSADTRLLFLIRQRANSYAGAKKDPELGKKLFTTHCANCHQIASTGGKIGPNLDGIGNRGAERLCEDVLDPNRNVDAAFRTTILDLKDGKTIAGLMLRQEGKVLVIGDAQGKELRIPEVDVEKKRISNLSPMPADWGDKLKEAEFYHIIGYLMEQRVKARE